MSTGNTKRDQGFMQTNGIRTNVIGNPWDYGGQEVKPNKELTCYNFVTEKYKS